MIKKVSDIENMPPDKIPPFLLGAMLNKIELIRNNFLVYSDYRKSPRIDKYISDENFKNFLESKGIDFPNNISDYKNYFFELSKYNLQDKYNKNCENKVCWKINCNRKVLGFYIENDLNYSELDFFNMLFSKLQQCSWLNNEGLYINSKKSLFLKGFMEPRGSIDTSRNFITIDMFYNDILVREFENLFIYYFGSSINLNFRYSQPQYIGGENLRNTQFRISLNSYINYVGIDNIYKLTIYMLF